MIRKHRKKGHKVQGMKLGYSGGLGIDKTNQLELIEFM